MREGRPVGSSGSSPSCRCTLRRCERSWSNFSSVDSSSGRVAVRTSTPERTSSTMDWARGKASFQHLELGGQRRRHSHVASELDQAGELCPDSIAPTLSRIETSDQLPPLHAAGAHPQPHGLTEREIAEDAAVARQLRARGDGAREADHLGREQHGAFGVGEGLRVLTVRVGLRGRAPVRLVRHLGVRRRSQARCRSPPPAAADPWPSRRAQRLRARRSNEEGSVPQVQCLSLPPIAPARGRFRSSVPARARWRAGASRRPRHRRRARPLPRADTQTRPKRHPYRAFPWLTRSRFS